MKIGMYISLQDSVSDNENENLKQATLEYLVLVRAQMANENEIDTMAFSFLTRLYNVNEACIYFKNITKTT